MIRKTVGLLLAFGMISGGQSRRSELAVNLCELSKDYGAYRDQVLAIRGVYYYGLRQTCQQTCAAGPWPSFVDLLGSENGVWDALAKTEQTVEREAKNGKQFEIWVTAHGQLKTQARLSLQGPCDRNGSGYSGYGHLGGFPAQLVVSSFSDIEVIENPKSPYDYAKMYHGAL